MRELVEILKSLVGPLFTGIYQVLTGAFGLTVALLAWIQVGVQFYLAQQHTAGALGLAIVFAILVILQGAGALVSFLIPNGNAYAPTPDKAMTPVAMYISAAFASVLVVFLAVVAFGFVLGWLVGLHGIMALASTAAVIAAVQSFAVVGRMLALAKAK